MAQLTWRNIDAPQLSTRDLAIAGNQVASSFDRLGMMLANREDTLRKQATDAAIAQRLVQQDPNQMGTLDLTGLDKRVDLRALAQADNDHRAQLVERGRANEELLNSQAWAKYGTAIEALGTAALNGDKEAEQQLRAAAGEDPMFARAIGQNEAWSKIVGFRDDRVDNLLQRDQFGETVRANKADEAADQQRIGLERQRVALAAAAERRQQQQQNDIESGYAQGQAFARKYRLLDGESASAMLMDDAEFQRLNPRQQRGVLESFSGVHKALTTETAGTRQGLAGADRQISAAELRLQARANAAENGAKSPSLAPLRVAGQLQGKVTMDSVVDDLVSRQGWQGTRGMARDTVQKMLVDNSGAALEDIQAAINVHGYEPGILKQIPAINEYVIRSENRALNNRVGDAVALRARGYTSNEELDVATARAPIEQQRNEIRTLREQAGRFVRAQERGQLTPTQQQQLDRITARLAELTQ